MTDVNRFISSPVDENITIMSKDGVKTRTVMDGEGNTHDIRIDLGELWQLQENTKDFSEDGYGLCFLDFDMGNISKTLYSPLWFANMFAHWKIPAAITDKGKFNRVFMGNKFLMTAQKAFLDGLEEFFTGLGDQYEIMASRVRVQRLQLEKGFQSTKKRCEEQMKELTTNTEEEYTTSLDAKETLGTSSNTSQGSLE